MCVSLSLTVLDISLLQAAVFAALCVGGSFTFLID